MKITITKLDNFDQKTSIFSYLCSLKYSWIPLIVYQNYFFMYKKNYVNRIIRRSHPE